MRMSRSANLLTSTCILATCVVLGACRFPGQGGGKAPTGQIVATVDGKEITLLELRAELGSAHFTDPKQQKAAEQAALQRIVVRKILAKAARDQGLDKSPTFALQHQRTEDALLDQTLEENFASQVPAPTREEAQSFVSSHPDMFAERKVFLVDQIRMAPSVDQNLVKQMQPLNTLDAIAALLTANHVDFKRGSDTLDALSVTPQMVEAVMKLPPGEVFIYPTNGMVVADQIRETHVTPFLGDPAVNYAMQFLRIQRTREAVGRQMSAILTKAAGKVRYNDAYKPPKPTPVAPPAASAAPKAPAGK